MKPLAIATAVLGIALLAAAAHAQVDETIDADRPHVGTGTHTVPPGEVQFELGGLRQSFGDRRGVTVPVLMRVGVGSRVEARLASDGVSIESGSGRTTTDVADPQAGVKLRLLGGRAEPWLSILPAFTFGANDSSITLLAGAALTDRAHVEANYGIASIGGRSDRFAQHLLTGAVTHATTRALTTYVEAAWWSRQDSRGGAVSFVDYGAIYALTPRLLIDGGAFSGLTDDTANYGLFAGVSFVVGTPRRADRLATSAFQAAPGRD